MTPNYICENCGAKFKRARFQRFCSIQCRNAFYSKQQANHFNVYAKIIESDLYKKLLENAKPLRDIRFTNIVKKEALKGTYLALKKDGESPEYSNFLIYCFNKATV